MCATDDDSDDDTTIALSRLPHRRHGGVYASDDDVTIARRRRHGGEDEERRGEGQGQDKVRGVRTNSEAHSGDGNVITSKVRRADKQGDSDADEGRGPW